MKPPDARLQRICSIPGCGKPRWVRGWCNRHYKSWRIYGDPLAPIRRYGIGSIKDGYRRLSRQGRVIFEHREVMERLIGRSLRPEESVHHRNGIRHDNRPENLELWSSGHRGGQRVGDRLFWALDFLALYYPETLSRRGRRVLTSRQLPFDFLAGVASPDP